MVIGLLAVAAIPTVIGVGEAVSAQKKQNAANKEQEKFHIEPEREEVRRTVGYSTLCVLQGGKLWIREPGWPTRGHEFCGYHFRYPDEEQHLGMVSTISDDPPKLSWVFVNRDTRALEYGARKDTLGKVIGPWAWTEDGAWVTLHGDPDSFVARKLDRDDGEAGWALHWDPDHAMLGRLKQDHCQPVKLRRRPLTGVESRYVRDDG